MNFKIPITHTYMLPKTKEKDSGLVDRVCDGAVPLKTTRYQMLLIQHIKKGNRPNMTEKLLTGM